MFVPCLFPVIYMSSTSVKGETFYVYVELNVTVQSLVQPVLQVTYDDIHQTQMSRCYLIE